MGTLAIYLAGATCGAVIMGLSIRYANRKVQAAHDQLRRDLEEAERSRRWYELREARETGYQEGRLSPANDAERFVSNIEQFGTGRMVIKGKGGRPS